MARFAQLFPHATIAVVLSVAVHSLLAVAIVACLELAPGPEVKATLDVSSVELSFAEEDRDVPALAPMPPSQPSEPAPRPETRPPEPPSADLMPTPPDPDSLAVKPPESEVVRMEEIREETREKPEERSVSAPVQTEAPKQARIDAPPRPRKAIRPHYPEGARLRGEQGDVMLEILVGADGSAGDVRVVSTSGFDELDDAAVRAVRVARFVPAKSGGESVASTARLKLTFRLRN